MVGFEEEKRKTACTIPWTGDASAMPVSSPLSLSTVWIAGFSTSIYLRFFCYRDFYFFLSLFLSWDRGSTAVSEAMDCFYHVCKGGATEHRREVEIRRGGKGLKMKKPQLEYNLQKDRGRCTGMRPDTQDTSCICVNTFSTEWGQ